MVKTVVDATCFQYFYDLLGRSQDSFLEVCDGEDGGSFLIVKDKSAARQALGLPNAPSIPPNRHIRGLNAQADQTTRISTASNADGQSSLFTDTQRKTPPQRNLTETPSGTEGLAEQGTEEGTLTEGTERWIRAEQEEEGSITRDGGRGGTIEAVLREEISDQRDRGGKSGHQVEEHGQEGGEWRSGKDGDLQPTDPACGTPIRFPAKRKAKGGEKESTSTSKRRKRARKGKGTHVEEVGADERGSVRERAAEWLLQQIQTSEDPSVRATSLKARTDMVRTALDVAGPDAVGMWYDVLHHWRHNGRLVAVAYEGVTSRSGSHSPRAPPVPILQRAELQGPAGQARREKPGVRKFRQAYETTEVNAIVALIQPTFHRTTLADLYAYYLKAAAEIEASQGDRGNLTRRDARLELFQACYPTVDWIDKPWTHRDAKAMWNHFDYHIRMAKVMHSLRAQRGVGFFGLLPTRVTNKYLTQTLTAGRLALWLGLVTRFNVRCSAMEEKVDLLLQRGFAGLMPSPTASKRLLIERISRQAALDTADPGQLFDVVDPTTLSDGGAETPHSRPHTAEAHDRNGRNDAGSHARGEGRTNLASQVVDQLLNPPSSSYGTFSETFDDWSFRVLEGGDTLDE